MGLNRIAENTYEFTLNDQTSKEEIREIYDAFQQFEERGEHINLLGNYESFPSTNKLLSIGETINMKRRSFKVINKYAVVTDEDWMEEIIPVANFFTPSLFVKAFDEDDRDQALEWLAKEEIKEVDPKEYLTGVDIQPMDDCSYFIDLNRSEVDLGAMMALHQILDDTKEGEKINLLVHFREFPSFDSFRTFIEGLKVDLKIFGRLRNFAIVSDARWIETYATFGDFLTPGIDVKAFHENEMELAKEWVVT